MNDVTSRLVRAVRHNCDISDARDNGIYSLCTLVLKLRNLYKWEHRIEPWDEPDSAVVLQWIEEREAHWGKIAEETYSPCQMNGLELDPFDVVGINARLNRTGLFYGAGYGRSLKALFFLAEIDDRRTVDGVPVVVLGRELARELASPIAMVQDSLVVIRREQMRFFFWDRLQEAAPSAKSALLHALSLYGLLDRHGKLDRQLLRENLDRIVALEMPAIIHHEIGEMQDLALGPEMLRKIAAGFPDSLPEFVARAVKDILADTHEAGMLGYILAVENEASLALYVSLLDGLRRHLFPEIVQAFSAFRRDRDWQALHAAREAGRRHNTKRAERFTAILKETTDPDSIKARVEAEILGPLGLLPKAATT